MAVGQGLQRAAALAVRTDEAVVANQRVEPVAAAVPDVPDEGALVEKPAVLLEETVAQPFLDRLGRPAARHRGGQQLPFRGGGPVIPIGRGEQQPQPVGRRGLAAHGCKTDNAIGVSELIEAPAAIDPRAYFLGHMHLRVLFCRPAVTEQPGDSDVQNGRIDTRGSVGRAFYLLVPNDAAIGVAVKKPLSGIVGVWFGKPVRVPLSSDSLPVDEIKRHL